MTYTVLIGDAHHLGTAADDVRRSHGAKRLSYVVPELSLPKPHMYPYHRRRSPRTNRRIVTGRCACGLPRLYLIYLAYS